MNSLYFIAFMTGLVSSLHCVGMCGPIALALPVGGQSFLQAFINRAIYNFGRILTYSLFGLIWGYFGKTIHIIGLQKEFSILVGLLLLISILPKTSQIRFPFQNLNGRINFLFRKLFKVKNSFGFLLLGIANGFLPCSMVYMALAGAAISSTPIKGAIFMALFGLGTAPMMFLISFMPRFLTIKTRQKINKYLPVYTLFLAIIILVRGIYISSSFMKKDDKFHKQEISICRSSIQ